MKEMSHAFFENKDCEYYPCHKGVDEINCLFCYCPLYNLADCPGNPSYKEKDGRIIKVCTNCIFPHKRENYKKVTEAVKKRYTKGQDTGEKRALLPRVMLAGTGSGTGKTLISSAIMRICTQRGLKVAPFKCGPDYIDPMYHRLATGYGMQAMDEDGNIAPGGNLDTFFTDRDTTIRLLYEGMLIPDDKSLDGGTGIDAPFAVTGGGLADIAVIEGVMGLYDGLGGTKAEGSSYDVAAVTNTPIILIVDGKGAGRSVAATIKGFLEYDTKGLIKGVILNRVSPMYFERLKAIIEGELGIRVAGYVPYDERLTIGSRHLGLITPDTVDHADTEASDKSKEYAEYPEGVCDVYHIADAAADIMIQSIDMDIVTDIAHRAGGLNAKAYDRSLEVSLTGKRAAIKSLAVAMDEAFCFYYRENLRMLRDSGIKLIPFSPVHDSAIPKGADGLLLGGGYPEEYLKELSDNKSMRDSVRKFMEDGGYIIAECGGFMYLHEKIGDKEGKLYDMAGVLPGICEWTGKLVRFGYIELNGSGIKAKGHEFHYYDSSANGEDIGVIKAGNGREYRAMYDNDSMLAGFPHLYYPSCVR